MVLTEEERIERKKISKKKYRQSEIGKKKNKQYRQNEKGKNWCKKYRQSELGKKSQIKSVWKKRGLNIENFEEIYERYTMAIFCEICECVLNIEGNHNTKKCMDHCHITGEFRNIVCHYCNRTICK